MEGRRLLPTPNGLAQLAQLGRAGCPSCLGYLGPADSSSRGGDVAEIQLVCSRQLRPPKFLHLPGHFGAPGLRLLPTTLVTAFQLWKVGLSSQKQPDSMVANSTVLPLNRKEMYKQSALAPRCISQIKQSSCCNKYPQASAAERDRFFLLPQPSICSIPL